MFKSLKQNNEEIQYYGFNIISQKKGKFSLNIDLRLQKIWSGFNKFYLIVVGKRISLTIL